MSWYLKCNLKKYRIAKKYTIRQLSKKTGISCSYISTLENNLRVCPSLAVAWKLSNALNIDIMKLFEKAY